tara:strand:- start:2352 stop:2597 length:246 start_codon:yes stop_codon:yes gene_type:complete
MINDDLTTVETAEALEVSEGTVRRLIANKTLDAEKRAGAWFVDACSVERLRDDMFDDDDDEENDVDDDEGECDHCEDDEDE